MAEQEKPAQTPYQRARTSHSRQIDASNAAYRRGEIDIYELMRRGQWANHELSQYAPDKKKPSSNNSE